MGCNRFLDVNSVVRPHSRDAFVVDMPHDVVVPVSRFLEVDGIHHPRRGQWSRVGDDQVLQIGLSFGNALRQGSNKAKGDLGETVAEQFLARDAVAFQNTRYHGIDLFLRDDDGPAIIEVKLSTTSKPVTANNVSSFLGRTVRSGRQMSEQWINDKLDEVIEDPSSHARLLECKKIALDFKANPGNAYVMVIQTNAAAVTLFRTDGDGEFREVDSCKIGTGEMYAR